MPLAARDYDELRGLFGVAPLPQVSGQFALAATLSRNQGFVNTVALAASGVMLCVSINLPDSITITNISLMGGGTSEATGTHAWMALYTSDLRLLAQTVDDIGAASIVANTVYTKALTTPQKTPYSGLYYLGISVTATTMPTACGITEPANAGLQGIVPFIAGTTGSALLGVAPNPAAALTSSVSIPYMWVS